jgi:hypothetical protein
MPVAIKPTSKGSFAGRIRQCLISCHIFALPAPLARERGRKWQWHEKLLLAYHRVVFFLVLSARILADINLILCLASVEISQHGHEFWFLVAWNFVQMNMLTQAHSDATGYPQQIVFNFLVPNQLFANTRACSNAVFIKMNDLTSSFPTGQTQPWVQHSPYFAQSG